MRNRREIVSATRTALVAFFCILFPVTAHAWVADSTNAGFEVRDTTMVSAKPDDVFGALVHRIGEWWDPEHTFSGDARNLSLDPVPGGCFCEKLPDGGGVRHMTVVYVSPGKALRLNGALGPLQAGGLSGSMTWTLKPQGESTQLAIEYSVGGYFRGGIARLAPVVDGVLRAQLTRLKSYTETGRP